MRLIKLRRQHLAAIWVTAIMVAALFMPPQIHAEQQPLFPEIAPDPAYSPSEVVGIQMRALRDNDKPYEDAGIELTFRFASPSNKQQTGPLERFANLFDTPAYGAMIGYTKLEIGEEQISGNTAMVPVLIEDDHGNKAGYLFTLTKQSQEPVMNCWMTNSVVRIRLDNSSNTI